MASEGSSFGAGGSGGAVNESPGGGKLVNCEKLLKKHVSFFVKMFLFGRLLPPAASVSEAGEATLTTCPLRGRRQGKIAKIGGGYKFVEIFFSNFCRLAVGGGANREVVR